MFRKMLVALVVALLAFAPAAAGAPTAPPPRAKAELQRYISRMAVEDREYREAARRAADAMNIDDVETGDRWESLRPYARLMRRSRDDFNGLARRAARVPKPAALASAHADYVEAMRLYATGLSTIANGLDESIDYEDVSLFEIAADEAIAAIKDAQALRAGWARMVTAAARRMGVRVPSWLIAAQRRA